MVSKKDKYLAAAQKLIERRQLDKALAEFAKAIQEDPKDTRTLLKMAELHAKQGANAEATEIYLRTGDLYAEQGFAQKAVAVYKNVLKLSPGTVAAHLKVAALFNQLGLVSDAVQQFEAAAAGMQKDKPADAVAALRQAVDIQPDNVVLRVKLAESASQAGLVEDAVREFGKAADQLKALGRSEEYLRVMERLLFHQPANFAKARELAEAYIGRGNPRQALPKLQAALNGDPHEPVTLSLLAKALEQLGQVPKAISVLKELVRLCDELGRHSERDAAVLRGLTLDPNDQELRDAATRSRLRSAGEATVEATPPPLYPGQGAGASGGGSFDLSGAVRVPSAVTAAASGASGRVAIPVGGDEYELGRSPDPLTGDAADIARIFAEADVFVKYGLLERAADHLTRIFSIDPSHRPAREKLITVLQRLGRDAEADRHADILAEQMAETPPPVEIGSFGDSGPGISLNLDSGDVQSAFDASTSFGVGVSLTVVDEKDDPVADVPTPPPELDLAPSRRRNSGAITSGAAALDPGAEGIAVGAETSADLTLGGEITVSLDEQPDDDDGEDTPRLVRKPMPVAPSPHSFNGHALADDEDPTLAFSDVPLTVAVDPEQAQMTIAAFDDSELSAELEQVSFFIDQAMFEEARALLKDVEARFPPDARVTAHLRELQEAEISATATPPPVATVTPPPRPPAGKSSEFEATARIANPPTLGATLVQRPVRSDATPTPRAVVSGGGGSDAATHVDLGIAYKEMGLYDAAISEFKLACDDPTREVFALTAMGECYESKSSFTEAVIRYKRALNCDNITPEETLVLYFLLGAAFERLGDVSEALYFYEKVLKRESKFRDVDLKVAELRPRLVKRAR